jgi:PAS domain S-box-containing protein
MYLIFGCFWIVFSDQLLAVLAPDQRSLPQTLKGLFYVGLTSVLLWGLVNAFWQHIRQQEAYFRLLFSENALAMWVCDETFQVRHVNRTACQLFNISEPAWMGQTLTALLPDTSAQLFQHWIDQGMPVSGVTFTLLQGDSLRYVHIGQQPLPLSLGRRHTHHLFRAEDLTERMQAEHHQERLTQELLEHNADLMAFTSLTSHLLRVPAANIQGLLVLYEQASEGEKQAIIAHLRTSSQELEQAIQQLNHIVMARHSVQTAVEWVHLGTLFAEVQGLLAEPLESLVPQISFDLQVPQVQTLKSSLRTIFYHLFSNTLKFRCPERPLTVCISSRQTPQGVEISFQDNGLGIDLERYSKQLFLPYKRFHTANYGKGLGLYLVATLSRFLGGEVTVSSQLGKGTTFSLLLPDLHNQHIPEASPATDKVSK